jgi:hypothetical protein
LDAFDGTGDGIGGLFDGIGDLAAGALEGLLCFLAEGFGLLLEVGGGILEIVDAVVEVSAQLAAGFYAGLRGVEKRDGRTGGNAQAKSDPDSFCTHNVSSAGRYQPPEGEIQWGADWLRL